MRHIIIYIFIVFSAIQLFSQTVYTGLRVPYDPCDPCSGTNITYGATAYFSQPDQVASDFGPRYVKRKDLPDTPYDWHGGIDYNGFVGDGDDDKGYRLRSIVDGTIHAISTGSLKYIVIDGAEHDFGYLHMFVDGTATKSNPIPVGDCKFVLLDNFESTYGILVPHNGQQRLLAVCPNNNCSNRKYTIPGTQTTLTATNQVAAGDIIGVLGTSGKVGAHLHLNRYESLTDCESNGGFGNCDEYMLNPLEHVEHTGVNYTSTFHHDTTGITDPSDELTGYHTYNIKYPGTKSSTIMVRPMLNNGGDENHYTTATFNIRNVSLEIKKSSSSSYQQLIGNNYESKIEMGATDFYKEEYPSYINFSSVNSQGGWQKQGIYNFAYRDTGNPHGGPYTTSGGRPYDDFYFPFYTRVSKGSPTNGENLHFADIPSNSRYNDNIYDLKSQITDVRNGYRTITTKFQLDNFQPYITDFYAGINSNNFLHLERAGNEGKEEVAGDGFVKNQKHDYALSHDPVFPMFLTIEVLTSEPMQNLTCQYRRVPQPPLINPETWTQALPTQVSELKWTFSILANNYTDCFNVRVFGQDKAENPNQIINIYKNTDNNSLTKSLKIPTRKGNGASDWSHVLEDPGSDQFDFCIKDCEKRVATSGGLSPDELCDALSTIQSTVEYVSCGHAKISVSGQNFDPSQYSVSWTNENGELLSQYDDKFTIEVSGAGQFCYKISAKEACCNTEYCVNVDEEKIMSTQFNVQSYENPGCESADYIIWDVNNSGDFLYSNYSFKWSTGATSNNISVNSPGDYTVTITDRKTGCWQAKTFKYFDLEFELTAEVQNPDCDNGGSIYLYAEQNDPETLIKYKWSNGSTTADITDLTPGEYCVTVTNGFSINDDPIYIQGCQKTRCFTISGPNFEVWEVINPTCSGLPQSIIVNGLMPNYMPGTFTYLWDDGTTTKTRQISAAGQYCYSVTEVNTGTCKKGCIDVQPIVPVSASLVAPGICNQGTGRITTTVTGGTAPYSFKWSNGATSRNLSGLSSAIYTVTVTDKNKCTSVKSAEIKQGNYQISIFDSPDPLTSCISYFLHPNCAANHNDLYPLSFKWSSWQTTNGIQVTSSGNYCLTVTGANLCTATRCFDIKLTPETSVTVINNSQCPPTPGNGSITVGVTGGTPPYIYSYHPGPANVPNQNVLSGLAPGTYNITVTDANGCSKSTIGLVQGSSLLNFTVNSTDVCPGGSLGKATVNTLTGANYTINLYKMGPAGNSVLIKSISGYTYGTTFENLDLGSYYIELKGPNCGYGVKHFEIKLSQGPAITDIEGVASCIVKNTSPGVIKITKIVGGKYPYTYRWTDNSSGSSFSTSLPGQYSVTVTDANGCSISKSFTLTETLIPLDFDVELQKSDNCSSAVSQFWLKIKIKSGNPPYRLKVRDQEFTFSSTEYSASISKPVSGFWESEFFSIKLNDACNLFDENVLNVKCFDICEDNCIKITLKNTKSGGCAKVQSADYTSFGYLSYSYFKVENTCNDGQVRRVFNEFQNAEAIFTGKGKHDFPDLFGPGQYNFVITNESTGCKKSIEIPVRACKSVIKWLVDNFGAGQLSCLKYIKKNEDPDNCYYELFCSFNNETIPVQGYYIKCYREIHTQDTFGNEGIKYAIWEECDAFCTSTFIQEIDNKPSDLPKCECDIYVKPYIDPPYCDEEILEVVFDSLSGSYTAFWNGTDSIGAGHVYGYSFKNSQNPYDRYGTFDYQSSMLLQHVRLLPTGDVLLIGNHNGPVIKSVSRQGKELWSIPLPSFEISNVSAIVDDKLTIIGTTTDTKSPVSLTIDAKDRLLSINNGIIGSPDIKNIHLQSVNGGVWVEYLDTENILKINNRGITSEIKMIPSVNVKAVKIFKDKVIIGGEFQGELTINDLTLQSDFKNVIFMKYTLDGQLIDAGSPLRPIDLSLDHVSVGSENEIAYFGKLIEGKLPSSDDKLNEDLCGYVDFYTFKNDLKSISGKSGKMENMSTSTQNYNNTTSSFEVSIHPNPYFDVVNFDIVSDTDQQIMLSISDDLGRQIYNELFVTTKGRTLKTVSNLSNFPPGVYRVNMTGETGTIVKKIIKLK